jgi:transposase
MAIADEQGVVLAYHDEAYSLVRNERLRWERQLVQCAHELPVSEWWEGHRGLGTLGLGQIIGEAGDLSRFSTVARLWAWFGVGLTLKDGVWVRQRRFSRPRRAILRQIGQAAVVGLGREGPIKDLFLARKEYEREHTPGRSFDLYHNRARRYVEKYLLRQLWKEWNRVESTH